MDNVDTTFDIALRFVLEREGGYVDNPQDRGGPTNMGITLATFSAWRDQPVSVDDLQKLTVAEAAAIYRARYWNSCRCDELPSALALVVFDTAVNSGIHRAVMFLQSALEVPADGEPGRETLAAAHCCDVNKAVLHLLALRLAFLEGLPAWPVFGKGWQRRLALLEDQALSLSTENEP